MELKEALEFLGVDPAIDSLDKFKESFNQSFIKRDMQTIKDDSALYSKITGAYNESNKRTFKNTAKDLGIDVSAHDLDKLDVRGVFETVLPSILKEKNAAIENLTAETKKGTDKKLTDLQAQFDQYKAEAEPKISSVDKVQKEFEAYKNTVAEEKKQGKISEYKQGAWKDFKWANGVSEFAKKGFQADVESRYPVTIDESGNVFPTNDKGERIPNPKQAGTFKTLAEILSDEGQAANAKGEKIFAVIDNTQQTSAKQTMTVKDTQTQTTTPNGRPRLNTFRGQAA